jgi:hypothetical protein
MPGVFYRAAADLTSRCPRSSISGDTTSALASPGRQKTAILNCLYLGYAVWSEKDMAMLSGQPILRLGVIIGASLISFVASAQKPAPPIPGTEAYLARQDSSDCANSTVNANDPALIGGSALVLRQNDGNTSFKVAITASPDTTYNF